MTPTKTEAVVVLEEWMESNRRHQVIYYAPADQILVRFEELDGGWTYVPECLVGPNSLPDFNDYTEGFRLEFTGRMSLVVEQVGYGPMHIKLNDLPLVSKIIRVALEGMAKVGDDTDIGAYSEEEEVLLKRILDIEPLTDEQYQNWLDRHAV